MQRDVAERLLDRVQARGGHLVWCGGSGGKYPSMWVSGRKLGAHRIAWQIAFGELPAGTRLTRGCTVVGCVSPRCWSVEPSNKNLAEPRAEV